LNWDRQRFTPIGPITEEMARRTLAIGANQCHVKQMIERIEAERKQVQSLIRVEIEKLMVVGAEITGMTYNSKGTFNKERECTKAEHMRLSYMQNGDKENLQKIHFIFHELPGRTYEDVMMKRLSHMEYVCLMVERKMRVIWTVPTSDVTSAHKNCIQHVYGRIANDKKMTVCRKNYGCSHNKYPYVRSPKTFKSSGYSANYKRGKQLYYWKSPEEGEKEVSHRSKAYVIYRQQD
jgi:hypothetical protein